MTTIREYIRHNREFQKERINLTARPRLGQSMSSKNHHLNRSERSAQYPSPNFIEKKLSLPPISECLPKIRHFSLELKRSQALNQYFQAKNQSIVSKKRYKTQNKPRRLIQQRTSISINLEELRMRPVDKYFYKMENIRLAERLLVVKPSPEVQRQRQKKFFKQQKIYSTRLSRNGIVKRQSSKSKKLFVAENSWVS